MTFQHRFFNNLLITVIFLPLLASSLSFTTLQPEYFQTTPPVLDGKVAKNIALDSAQRLFEDKIYPPGCFATWKGVLYAGLADGRIVRVKNDTVETVVTIGGGTCERAQVGCYGRPNGISFDNNGKLLVADIIKGLYRVDVNKGTVSYLVRSTNEVDNVLVRGVNFAIAAKSGDIYFSVMSYKWDWVDIQNEFIEASANGRVLHYDPKTKKTSTLVDYMYFPNGIQLSKDEDFLIISQATKYNIIKYHLKGAKKGQQEVFADNVPGVPYNIHASPRGTFWVGLVGVRLPGQQSIYENLGPLPEFRKIIGLLVSAVDNLFLWVSRKFGFPFIQTLEDMFQDVKHELFLGPKYGFVIEVDKNGTIIQSLQSPAANIYHISDALELDGYLYLGTPFHPVIGKYKLNK